jgi:hypothetical protein
VLQNGHWMTSSTPSAHTTRTCATPYGSAGTSSTPSDTADHSSLYHLPHHEEGPASLGSLSNQKGEGVEQSHALIGRSTSSSEDTGRRRTEGNKSSTSTTNAPAPYRWSEHAITFSRADQWLNFDHPSKYPLLVDPVIRESRVKKVLVDGGSSINVTFPGHS